MRGYKGYTGKVLRVDLSTGSFVELETDLYSNRFIGGRGIAAKVHFDEVSIDTDAFDPENRLCIMTGPLCGVPGIAASRWQVSGKSPLHNTFSYCNLGGSWGAHLKFTGYDGLIIQGKSDELVYLIIDNGKVELKNAAFLKGSGAIKTRMKLKQEYGKSLRVAAIGAAGENMVHFATLTADSDSSGSSGMGAVFGSKNLKAIAVRGSDKIEVADPDRLSQLRKTIRKIKVGAFSWPTILPRQQIKKQLCFGCINGCGRQTFSTEKGESGKYMCQSAAFYETRAQRYHGKITDVSYYAAKLCDDLGIDTKAIETMNMWLSRCYKENILTDENTGIPLSKIGSLEFIETLLHKIALREGIGDTLAQGVFKAAEIIGQDSASLIKDYMIATGENEVYGPRLYITTGILYAMEPRQPIQQLHEISVPLMFWASRESGYMENFMTTKVIRSIGERFWGSEIAADFSTYEGKALAASMIQDRQYAKEALIFCDFSWPIIFSPVTQGNVGDPTFESRIFETVTGREMDETGLYHIGKRLFNLQRSILVREGYGGRKYDGLPEFCFTTPLKGDFGNPECLVPGEDGETISRKGMIVERHEFEKMRDEFYEIRDWDVTTGLQTGTQLEALDLSDVADLMDKDGLLSV
ncbi:MAG: hypothetical protein HN737_00770 [Desulfobacterales bacterium]|jgi:aldehyde:ferredoxin oxidoreductase|nr:hypothetical protein [Desulfobacteraceae bacterium]MBT7085549.1 hypothetical protein [Desulfobacterales bacterium]MBT7695924.1 hypothetical protein [Desulfobacterales bacterium]